VIECASCRTLNPDAEPACLMCGAPLQAATLRCPAGHPIDPSWRSCPYCDRLRAGGDGPGRSTRLEGAAAGPPSPSSYNPTVVQPTVPSGSRATRLEAVPAGLAGSAAPRRTMLAGALGDAGKASSPAGLPPAVEIAAPAAPISSPAVASRPLVAVLAAPSLGPGGTVFAVRQGKNTIGGDRASDVCLGADLQVSAEHALLLHRGTSFFLADRMSTNGTFVNGEEVPTNGTVALRDRDRIRCGGVELIFLQIEPVEPSSGASLP